MGVKAKPARVSPTPARLLARSGRPSPLHPSEQTFRNIVENANDVMYIHDEHGRLTWVNAAAEWVTGYSREELLRMKFADLLEPQFASSFRQRSAPRVRNREQAPFTVNIRAKDGARRTLEISARVLTEKGGTITLGIGRDITDRMFAEQALRESENRFRAFVEQASDVISLLDERGTIVYQSSSVTRHLGYDPEELIGSCCFDYVHPDDLEEAIAGFRQGLEDPSKGEAITLRLRHRNGRWKAFEVVSSIYEIRGEALGLLASFRFVGDRLEAEAELRSSAERYRQLFQRNLAGVFRSRVGGGAIDCNDSFAHLFGYDSREELLASDFNPYHSPEDRAEYIEKLKESGTLSNFEMGLRRRDGSEIWVLENVTLLEDDGESVIQGTLVDITERKRSERLQTALYRITECANTVDDLEHLYRALHSIVGELMYARNLYIGLVDDSGEFLQFAYFVDQQDEPPDARRLGRGLTEYVLRTGKPLLADFAKIQELETAGEIEPLGPDCIDWLGAPLRSGSRVFGVIAVQSYDPAILHSEGDKEILNYVSQHISVAIMRKRQEEALRVSEVRYRSLVESAVYGMYRSSVDGRFLDVNPALVKMLGYDSAEELLAVSMGRDIYVDAEERAKVIASHRQSGKLETLELRWKKKDGHPITVRLSGTPFRNDKGETLGFEMIAEDVSERRALEDQLRQSQKMEAVGRLAGGIAHDFNNLLTVIKGYSELVLDELRSTDPLRGEVDEIKKAADRAAALTRQLLAFSRQQVLAPKVLDLNSVVVNMDKLLHRLLGEDIALCTVLGEGLGRVKVDPGQVEQVVMNLAVNARDAMPQGGKLTVETANVDLDESYAREHVSVKAGSYVMIAVTDTGTGMSEKVKARIFEPFFTTKEVGKGTGLGLSTVYGIVKQSGGYVWVYSELGIGSTFKVYLPRVDAALEASARQTRAPARHGTETILLVEDEDGVRALMRQVLHRHGYNVLEARNGGEALLLCEKTEGKIDLLLTDVVLEQMSGRELAERLAKIRPDMKVLYASGYADDAIVHHGVLTQGVAFLQKPFTTESLARKVRYVLDGGQSMAAASS
ncbi:MAG TPA: PAS domain S-box protein [Terriglobales bacterium]|nr:PAS domain S-box protein [Terriglobales bacterium]